MFLSMNWISDFVNLDGIDLKKLISRFTLATAEVEDIYEFGKDINNVVIAKIISVEEHPNSRKLHLLKVDTGDEVLECVCGAPNIFVGALVPFAKCGGSVKGMEISATEIAGFKSYGMCCSEKELGISEDHSGVLIFNSDEIMQDVMKLAKTSNIDSLIGTDIKKIIDIDDTVFEVDNKSLTNRPDLWGHYGIAREISVLTGRPLKPLEVVLTEQYDALKKIDIDVETDLCYRYSCIAVENINKKVSPLNMKVRLTYCGQRPINLLADLTNYLMLELGQPMHAFDYAKVNKINVRTFEEPVTFRTLDDTQRTIEPETMMICDGTEPVAIAGIMGGLLSEIEDNTVSLLLESANFDAASVRKSATKLGMRTEASARYEKTLDPEMTVTAIGRFLKLLTEVDPEVKVISALSDVYRKHYDTVEIVFDKAYVDKYTGIDISEEYIESTLKALGFKLSKDGSNYRIIVPSYRATKDVTIKADIIEEITRIYGYDNFDVKSTFSLLTPVKQEVPREDEYKIKELLAYRFGLSEVHSYIWYDNKSNRELGIEVKSDVRISNSITAENDAIRQTLVPSLLSFVNKNLDGNDEVRIFEIANAVKGMLPDGLCNERKLLSFVLASKNKTENELLAEAKNIVDSVAYTIKNAHVRYNAGAAEQNCMLHPKNSALIEADNGKEIGVISVLNPRIAGNIDKKLNVAYVEIDYADFAGITLGGISYKEMSRFPGMSIDLSLLVDNDTTFGEVSSKISRNEFLENIEFVDIFRDDSLPTGKCSMTVRLQFISYERTLQSEEVNGFIKEILDGLKSEGIELRS